ncbi:MAG: UDP-N-acetylmuramoyl-L-alanine--D-glutamate ligase [Ectothiorhodospiraceae bacterium]|nr:UDP-N-acetylmuramoyl-L-alanine--D-glutamate ligase [Ectothiorhodospiraceae bacterium]
MTTAPLVTTTASTTGKHCAPFNLDAAPTLIVGLGQTGLSCARFLARCGVPFAVTDNREQPPALNTLRSEQKDIVISVGGFDAELFDGAQRVVVSPGVSLQEPLIAKAQQRGVNIMGDIELFARAAQAPVVAITGSNGKSTVTLLLAEMFKDAGKDVRVGGNIGTPALDLLTDEEPDVYVLELSSFQLDCTQSLQAAASVVLNISPDHMDRYADIAAYAASKQTVYGCSFDANAKDVPARTAIINRDDAMVSAMSVSGRAVVSFGLAAPDDNSSAHNNSDHENSSDNNSGHENYGRIDAGDGHFWLARGSQQLMSVNALGMVGEHNQANALAALALGEAMGLPLPSMLETLKAFSGLPHRLQRVAEVAGVTWLNDSKGTNVGATLAAIQGLTAPLMLIAGGQGKGADFSPLHDAVKDKVRVVILMGEDAALIETALANAVPVVRVETMSAAVNKASELAQSGDTVLLSPACASFDMFEGFVARGNAFMAEVHKLHALVKKAGESS